MSGSLNECEWVMAPPAPKRSKLDDVISHSDEGDTSQPTHSKADWWKKNIGMLTRRDVHGGEARSCLRFVLREGCATMTRDRIRIVGSCPTLGSWDVAGGADLLWQGGEWVSLLTEVPARSSVEYCILRGQRSEFECGWSYEWSRKHNVKAPSDSTVLEVLHANGVQGEVQTNVFPRPHFLTQPLQLLHPAGEQRCYTFDSAKGVTLHYTLYLPRNHSGTVMHSACDPLRDAGSRTTWPLVIFLHAMYNRLDGDNSLFYESDTPPRLLLDGGVEGEVSEILADNFIVLCPQCPPDPSWCDGVGTWLRQGWYTDNERPDPGGEAALWELFDAISGACSVDPDRVYLTGCSMGGFACLELVARRPDYFAAVVPIAAHYEENLDKLVRRLVPAKSVPFWFIHASNDQCCPHEEIQQLVDALQQECFSQVQLTTYEDTWSKNGHAADFVAFRSKPCSRTGKSIAMGNEIFNWLLHHRRDLRE